MSTPPTFNPEKYKQTTHDQWQAAAKAWNDWGPFLRRWLGPATELMLDKCDVKAGSRVLDVAAGAGDQTLQAAHRVGSTGRVLATDISPNILGYAQESASAAGYTQVQTQVADGERLDVPAASFDAVISRVGLIYFPDQLAALAATMRALVPGGKVGAIVYSIPDNNKFFSLPVSIIRRRANLPPPAPGQPGPFSLGAPGVLAALFEKAGFVDVGSIAVSAPLLMTSASECLRFEKESFGALHQMLSSLDEAGKDAAWTEIGEALASFERDGQFIGPCEMIVGWGRKP